MNWKDLLLIFLVTLTAILVYDKGVKLLVEPNPSKQRKVEAVIPPIKGKDPKENKKTEK